MDDIQKNLLAEIADLHSVPAGAYNIRSNGESIGRASTENIEIVTKTDPSTPGIDIIIKPGTKKESVHIPVIISQSGLTESVYNDFFVGDDCDVTIVAGCGIHNGGEKKSEHDGIHTFHVGRNSKVRYVEKHYGKGEGTGEIVLNPQTIVHLDEGAYVEMEMVQIKGVDSTVRTTVADCADNATIVVKEKLMTHGKQRAETRFTVDLNGKHSSTNLISRAVACDESEQIFLACINGNNECSGHSECDAIIMDNAIVRAIPEIDAFNVNAALIHEAAIGKIAGEQITKLMTLGMTEEEAEQMIVSGFLK